jgi:hypothetical protein
MIDAPDKIWDFWPIGGGRPVVWREPCPFPADDAEVFEYTRTDISQARYNKLEREAVKLTETQMQWEARIAELELALCEMVGKDWKDAWYGEGLHTLKETT